MVSETIDESSGEPLGSKHLGPLVEGQIAGHQGGAAFVTLAEYLEQEFGGTIEST